jgi:hypothetical protein
MQSLYLTIINARFILKYERSIFKQNITDLILLYKMNSQLTFLRYADSQFFYKKNVVKYHFSTLKHITFHRMQSTVNTNEKSALC